MIKNNKKDAKPVYKTKIWDKKLKKLVEVETHTYEPDLSPRGSRPSDSDVKVICPKTGEVLEVITKKDDRYWLNFNKDIH